jgi:catecholate siderophore receptor
MLVKKQTLAEIVRNQFAPAAVGLACALPLAVMAPSRAAKKDDNKDTTLPEVEGHGAERRLQEGDDQRGDAHRDAAARHPAVHQHRPRGAHPLAERDLAAGGAAQRPGVSYAAGESGTQANQVFYLRGFPAGGDLFIDGVRDLGEYNRDVFATESIEVMKGPSALIFGRGSTGGIINQTSKQPGHRRPKEVSATFGNFDKKRLTADWNANLGNDNACGLLGLAEDSGSFRYPQDVKRVGFAPSVRFGIGYPVDITLSYYFLKTRDVTDYGQPTLTPAYTGTGHFEMPPSRRATTTATPTTTTPTTRPTSPRRRSSTRHARRHAAQRDALASYERQSRRPSPISTSTATAAR